MEDPNDAELGALLRQGRPRVPKPSPTFEARVLRAYEARFASQGWRRFFFRKFSMPLPAGAFAGVVLLAAGFFLGLQLRFSANQPAVSNNTLSVGSTATNKITSGNPSRTLGGLQVVAELSPRIIRGANENK